MERMGGWVRQTRQLQRLNKVVKDKLGEDGEAVVVLEEQQLGLWLV
jgi:hypothetical protein